MLARAYFELVDAITDARTPAQLLEVGARITATAMHPAERRALERQLRARELTLAIDSEPRPVGRAQ